MAREGDNVGVHTMSLHGMLLGIWRETFAWDGSGRPDLITEPRSLAAR